MYVFERRKRRRIWVELDFGNGVKMGKKKEETHEWGMRQMGIYGM